MQRKRIYNRKVQLAICIMYLGRNYCNNVNELALSQSPSIDMFSQYNRLEQNLKYTNKIFEGSISQKFLQQRINYFYHFIVNTDLILLWFRNGNVTL